VSQVPLTLNRQPANRYYWDVERLQIHWFIFCTFQLIR